MGVWTLVRDPSLFTRSCFRVVPFSAGPKEALDVEAMAVAVLVGGVVAVSCGQTPASSFQNNIDPDTETSFGGPPAYEGSIGGLPCDVATVVRTRCASCHRTPLAGNATMPLTTWAELTAASPSGASYAARSLLRMKDAASPMPPGAKLPAAEIAAFEAWVNAGAKTGNVLGRRWSADGDVPHEAELAMRCYFDNRTPR